MANARDSTLNLRQCKGFDDTNAGTADDPAINRDKHPYSTRFHNQSNSSKRGEDQEP